MIRQTNPMLTQHGETSSVRQTVPTLTQHGEVISQADSPDINTQRCKWGVMKKAEGGGGERVPLPLGGRGFPPPIGGGGHPLGKFCKKMKQNGDIWEHLRGEWKSFTHLSNTLLKDQNLQCVYHICLKKNRQTKTHKYFMLCLLFYEYGNTVSVSRYFQFSRHWAANQDQASVGLTYA